MLPPPNVTGTLHLGHAFEDSIQDTVVRYQRMCGKKVLWIPGTDHAPIATESKVAKLIEKEEGKRKRDFTREEFISRVEKFAQESHDTIVNQVKHMGASLDWSREAFTFDEKRNLAVRTAFKTMYDGGLIYRGYKVVNWDPKDQTTISDDETVYQERKAILYTFKYAHDFPIAISTTRPETKVGDTAVAVHPDDARYKQFIGQTFTADFLGESLSIQIIGDTAVDPEFGTGALGVTPAHSIIDWEIAQRHNLPMKQVIDEYAKMMVASPLLAGKKTTEAQQIVATWLREQNLMIEEKEVDQNVSTAERSGAIIEPLPKLQWFIDVNKKFPYSFGTLPHIEKDQMVTLKELMLSVVKEKNIDIVPERFEKVYTHWIENLRDWCISRQIWYGHRIPVWYKGEEMYCGIDAPSGDGWTQDTDTLDTWFSSSLWTFSTLGWPEKTADLSTYHPTTLMCPGYEILFFWVARMVLMSTYLLGEIPFKTVYLHGIVRDAKGQKFSKSQGNGIDPMDVSKEYGTDALRMALLVGVGPGNDSKFDMAKVKAYKHFANKLWNISRFILESTQKVATEPAFTEKDTTMLAEFKALLTDITTDMEDYKFYLAAEKLYAYVWHTLADVIIEDSKPILFQDTAMAEEKLSRSYLLRYILEKSIIALHPFMPFITEELWGIIRGRDAKSGATSDGVDNILMVEPWPQV